MRIFTHGTDKGNAVLSALVLIMALSSVFVALVLRINTIKRYALEYKARVLLDIERSNEEIKKQYDFY
jgi:hypothetical protein